MSERYLPHPDELIDREAEHMARMDRAHAIRKPSIPWPDPADVGEAPSIDPEPPSSGRSLASSTCGFYYPSRYSRKIERFG
ncbi:MAG: hypothetical protein OXG27_15995 [Chloroflexi bacterium]|nr:hypothetical protein [Chloroflexota bacterium]